MSGIEFFFIPVRRLSKAAMKQVSKSFSSQKVLGVRRARCNADAWKGNDYCKIQSTGIRTHLEEFYGELGEASAFDLPPILHQFDHLLETASRKNQPLHNFAKIKH